MAETIGTAYLNIEVRTDNMQAGLSTAKRSVSDMSAAAQAEYNKLTAAQKRVADSALSYAQTIGKAREEVRALNVEQRIGGQLGKEIAATIRAQAAAQQAATAGMAMSAKQTQAALRGVPAQITDIVTSLQGGQAPLTVLLQQGGQLKDSFGGIGAAARGLGSTIAGMVTPVTALAAGAAALVLAAYQGSQESTRLAQALAQTGNVAGITTSELVSMSEAIAANGVTQGKAVEALAAVASSGKFTAEQFGVVAEAAVLMERATGQAIDETVKQFATLASEPVDAVNKLNEAHRFLTLEVYEQVKALQDQGREHDAATVAMQAWADAIADRAADVSDNIGFLERRWRELGAGAKWAWDQMLGIGRDLSLADQIAEQQAKITELRRRQRPGYSLFGNSDELKEALAERQRLIRQQSAEYKQAVEKAAAQNANDTAIALSRAASQTGSKIEQLEAKKARTLREAGKASVDAITANDLALSQKIQASANKVIADIDRQIEEERRRGIKKPRKPGKTDAQREAEQAARAAQSLLERIRQQVALNDEAARSTDQLTASERLAVAAKLDLAKISGKVQASQRQEIEAALEQLRVSGELVEAQKAQKELAEDLARARTESAMALLNQARANSAEIAGLVLGRQALEQAERRLAIEQEFEDNVAALRQQGLAETSESFRQQVAVYAQTRDEMLAKEEEHQRRLAEVRADWRNGARSALEDYATAAADVAGQTYDVFSGAMSGLEDALVEFAKTGKLAFSDLVDSIIADITRMFARQAVQQLFGAMFGGAGQGSGFMAWATGNPLSGGWSSGGYTGPGGKYEPAGIVHRGEVVWSQDDIRRAGGVAVVEALRRGTAPGYASGGVVGMRAPPRSTKAAEPQKVTVLVENYSSTPARAEESTDAEGGKLIKVIVDAAVSEVDRRIGAMGSTGRTIQGRFGLAPMGGSRG